MVQGVNALLKAWAARVAQEPNTTPAPLIDWPEAWGGAGEFTAAAPAALREALAPEMPGRRPPQFQTAFKLVPSDPQGICSLVCRAADEEVELGAQLFTQLRAVGTMKVVFPEFKDIAEPTDSATDGEGNDPAEDDQGLLAMDVDGQQMGEERSAAGLSGAEGNDSSATGADAPAVEGPESLPQVGVVMLMIMTNFMVSPRNNPLQ